MVETSFAPPPPEKYSLGLGKAINNGLDTLTKIGVPILKYGGVGVSAAAEIIGLPVLWPAKLALVAAGYGIDKLSTENPKGRLGKLTKALGEGAWKGGAFGFASSILLNTVMPQEHGLKFTENLAGKIHDLDLPNIFKKGQAIPLLRDNIANPVIAEVKKVPAGISGSKTIKEAISDTKVLRRAVENNISGAAKAISPPIEGLAAVVTKEAVKYGKAVGIK